MRRRERGSLLDQKDSRHEGTQVSQTRQHRREADGTKVHSTCGEGRRERARVQVSRQRDATSTLRCVCQMDLLHEFLICRPQAN